MVEVKDRSAKVRCLFRFSIGTGQGCHIMAQIMTEELAEVGVTNARGKRAFPFHVITHRVSYFDEFGLFGGANRLGSFREKTGVMPLRRRSHLLGMTAGRGLWGR